eukprot:447558-Pelagomonas_calceolata.AAC.6
MAVGLFAECLRTCGNPTPTMGLTLKIAVGASLKPISCHVGTPTSASLMPGRLTSTGGRRAVGAGRAVRGWPTRSTNFSNAWKGVSKGSRLTLIEGRRAVGAGSEGVANTAYQLLTCLDRRIQGEQTDVN